MFRGHSPQRSHQPPYTQRRPKRVRGASCSAGPYARARKRRTVKKASRADSPRAIRADCTTGVVAGDCCYWCKGTFSRVPVSRSGRNGTSAGRSVAASCELSGRSWPPPMGGAGSRSLADRKRRQSPFPYPGRNSQKKVLPKSSRQQRMYIVRPGGSQSYRARRTVVVKTPVALSYGSLFSAPFRSNVTANGSSPMRLARSGPF